MHQISAGTRPVLVVHSDDDQSVPVRQAVDMDAARAFIAEVEGDR